MDYRHTSGTHLSLKMSYRVPLAQILTVITAFLLIIEPVHGANITECDPDAKFICEKVITNIANCSEKRTCQTISIKMMKKCDTSYKGDETIKRKCEEWPTDENQLQNQFLTLPVINSKKGVSYWNMYCALCNYDDEFKFEDPVLLPTTVERCGLTAFVNFNFAFKESIVDWYKNVLCYGNTTRIIREKLLKSDYHCNKTPSYTEMHDSSYRTFGKYCNNHSSINCPKLPFRNDLICSYRSGMGKYCEYDWFLFEGFNFAYGENGDIYVPSFYKTKFLQAEYTNLTGAKGIIYLCGREWDRVYVPMKIFAVLCFGTSVVFFVLCIVLNWNKQSLQNLPDRTLYSFCIAQMMYSLLRLDAEFPMIDGTCIAANFIFNYAACTTTLWNVVVFFEHSRVLYFLIRNLELPDEVGSKKYLVYCFVCWILPALPTLFPLFFISMFGEKSSCPKIKDYSLVYCRFDQTSHSYAGLIFELFPVIYRFSANLLAFGSIGVILTIFYLSRQYYSIGYNERNYRGIFKKTSLVCAVTSFHFVFSWLEETSVSFANGFFENVFHIFDSLMGVSIFFVCYYHKDIVDEVLVMCKLRKPVLSENTEVIERDWEDVSHFSKE